MDITLDLKKNIDANASGYYEAAKRARKKMEGAKQALGRSLQMLQDLQQESQEAPEQKQQLSRKAEWYEKFRWFFTSTGFLVIGGRDATTNDIIIKKHAAPQDIVFHTDMAGSPFFVIKTEGKQVDMQTLKEVADATCTFSRAWKLMMSTQAIFYVKPDQLSKTPNTGEFLSKGAFVVRGKTSYVDNRINLAVGMREDGKIMSGPQEAVKQHCAKMLVLKQGASKVSDIAKLIKKKIGGDLDEIIRALPGGGFSVEKG